MHAAGRLLATIDVTSLAVVGMAIVLVCVARSRLRLAVGSGVVIAGSILTTELLKHVVLGRPDLGVVDALRVSHATYPSGHTTVALALGVAATLVVTGAAGVRSSPASPSCTPPRSAWPSSPPPTTVRVIRSAPRSW